MGRVAEHRRLAPVPPLVEPDAFRRVETRVELALAVDVGPAVLLAFLDEVQLLHLLVVAEPVDAVIEAVQRAGRRMPAEADGVAQARREDLSRLAVEARLEDGGVLRVRLVALVAGGADLDVEHPVRPDRERAVLVLAGVRQVVDDPPEVAEGAVRQDIGHVHVPGGDHVGFAGVDRDPMHVRAGRHGLHGLGASVAVLVLEHDDVADRPPAGVDGAVLAHREPARVDEAVGEDGDVEAGRQLEEVLRAALRRLQLARLQHAAAHGRVRVAVGPAFEGEGRRGPERAG